MYRLMVCFFAIYQFTRIRCHGDGLTEEQRERKQVLLKQKIEILKTLWIITGLFMLLNPLPAIMITTLLFMTFLSFSLLDETSDQ
ncbi:hypothetical protein [Gynuella sp.]|uniref:hypothetical protein n=1 Tax=Gynuella sp. TaxID=2969146 RepID=UPI003D0C527B